MQKRAVIYVREPVDRSITTDAQIVLLKEIAATMGCIIVGTYRDGAMIGKDRPTRGFEALRRVVANGQADLVLAYSLNDLGALLTDVIKFARALRAQQVELYCHAEGLNTAEVAGTAFLDAMEKLAGYQSALHREAIIAGQNRARAASVRFGRPPISKQSLEKVRHKLAEGDGIRPTARKMGVSPATVHAIRKAMIEAAVSETVTG